jgi:hypothetical protein
VIREHANIQGDVSSAVRNGARYLSTSPEHLIYSDEIPFAVGIVCQTFQAPEAVQERVLAARIVISFME